MKKTLNISIFIIVLLLIVIVFMIVYPQPNSINKQFKGIRYSAVNNVFTDLSINDIDNYTNIEVNINGDFKNEVNGIDFNKYFEGEITIYEENSESIIYINKAYHEENNVYKGQIFIKNKDEISSGFIYIYSEKNNIEKIFLFYHKTSTKYNLISIPAQNIEGALQTREFLYR